MCAGDAVENLDIGCSVDSHKLGVFISLMLDTAGADYQSKFKPL